MDIQAIKEILAVARRLDEKNLVNAYEGNISVKRDGLIYITPTGKNKGLLTEEMIAVVREDGTQIGGCCKPTSELTMHRNTYEIRPEIGGIVHCHPTFMTAYAICNLPVETKAYPEMIGNFGVFEVAPYGRPGTEKILEGAIPIFAHSDICMLGNHGVLAVGETVFDAMNRIEAAEAITQTLFLSRILGKEKELDSEELDYLNTVRTSKR